MPVEPDSVRADGDVEPPAAPLIGARQHLAGEGVLRVRGRRAGIFRADDEDPGTVMRTGRADGGAIDAARPEEAVGSLAANQRESADETGDEGIGRRLINALRRVELAASAAISWTARMSPESGPGCTPLSA